MMDFDGACPQRKMAAENIDVDSQVRHKERKSSPTEMNISGQEN